MGLTTDQIDILVDSYVVKLYQDFEQEVISDIARRVAKTGRYTETAEIMARNLREQGYNTGEIQAKVMKSLRADRDYKMAVAEETKAYKTEVKKMIADLEEEALKAGDMLVATAGDMAWNDDMQMWSAHDVDLKKDNTLTQLKQAFTKQTQNALLNLTQSGGGIGVGYYGITDAFTHEMDLATIKVASGAFSYNQAVRECVKNLSQHGVNIKYPSGRKYQIDTAARMTLRTATSQLAGRVTEMNLRKTSTPLVYVDAHAGARPEHAQWQGAVYVYDKTKQNDYPNYKDFWTTTDYGSVTGLKGVNCSHNFYPYWEGDAIPDYQEPEPVMINGKEYTYYEATQEQRRQERQIRQGKREYETLKAIKATPEELQRAQAKLSKQVNEYKQFSASAGIRAKTERLGIVKENAIKSPAIENRGKSYGKAGDIELFGGKLSKRQNDLLSKIDSPGRYTVNKKDISLNDLAAMTASTGCEFAMFTKGNERLIIRGGRRSVAITYEEVEHLAKQGYRWSGHTHPGITHDTLDESPNDNKSLRICQKHTGQSRSVVYNSAGNFQIFEVK